MGVFTDKTIVITGASEGIGRALALILAEQKPKLVLAARNETRLLELKRECEELGAQAHVVSCDLSRREDCQRLIDASLVRFGSLDALINNAGITMWADFASIEDPELIRKVMDINFFAVAYCTYYALPHLKAAKGWLVGVASIAGLIGVPGHVVYGASKHAVSGFLDALRPELKEFGVSVTVIAPDFVVTEIHHRGLNAQGQAMKKRLDPNAAISAKECAAMMAKAIERRERLLITSYRGRWAVAIKNLLPNLLDKLVMRSSRQHGLY